VHGAGQADAADEPDQAGRVSELRGEDGADEGPGAGNRGKVMAEQHPAGGDVVVLTVRADVCGSGPAVVQAHDAGRDERTVEPEGDRENPENGDDDVKGPHFRGF